MSSEIEIETEKSQKTQITTQEVNTWFLQCSYSMILISKLCKKEVGQDSSVCINSKENENIMSFHSKINNFLVIKEQAHSLGVPGLLF